MISSRHSLGRLGDKAAIFMRQIGGEDRDQASAVVDWELRASNAAIGMDCAIFKAVLSGMTREKCSPIIRFAADSASCAACRRSRLRQSES
jgi:hypothetical protein